MMRDVYLFELDMRGKERGKEKIKNAFLNFSLDDTRRVNKKYEYYYEFHQCVFTFFYYKNELTYGLSI